VEFALVAPILLVLLLGIVDFARAWNTYQVITDAAREGARTAVIDDDTTVEQDVYDVVNAALARGALDTDDATVTVTGFGSGRGNPASVRIEYSYTLGLFSGLVENITGSALTLRTEIVMRNE
jgi:Flp pilus assembly protein TadG